MKIIFSALIILLISTMATRAQLSHNLKPGSQCRYFKGFKGGDQQCLACENDKKKEHEVKQAAIKKAQDEAAAKAKAQQEAEARKRRERQLAEEKERQRRAEEEARAQREALAAKQRLEGLLAKYSNNHQDKKADIVNVGYIEELECYVDHDAKTYGIKIQDNIVVSNSHPNNVGYINIDRIEGTNYFRLQLIPTNSNYGYRYLNNTYKIMNMYGQIVKIDGFESFYSISANDGVVELKHLFEPLAESHSEKLESGWEEKHVSPIYNSRSELTKVHESLVEAADAAFIARNRGSSGVIIGMSRNSLYAGSGTLIRTDLNLKTVERQSGIIYTYW